MVNQAAKAHYMSGGKIKVPIVFRTTLGATRRSAAIVVDEGYERYGTTAEISSVIAEGAFYHLDAPVKRIGAMDVPVPFSPVLEDLTVPTEQAVADAAKALCRKA